MLPGVFPKTIRASRENDGPRGFEAALGQRLTREGEVTNGDPERMGDEGRDRVCPPFPARSWGRGLKGLRPRLYFGQVRGYSSISAPAFASFAGALPAGSGIEGSSAPLLVSGARAGRIGGGGA
jgi:hypothetical protein